MARGAAAGRSASHLIDSPFLSPRHAPPSHPRACLAPRRAVTTGARGALNPVPPSCSAQVLDELQAIADADLDGHQRQSQFTAHFGPNSDLAYREHGWSAVALMNKGELLPEGCDAAPITCAVLGRLHTHLAPRAGAEQVGVRLLKLEAGAALRAHVGPGGRLVAHLGLRVPTGAALTVDTKVIPWVEGGLVIFDDSFLHSAVNHGSTARYILHVTFPVPSAAPAVIQTTTTPHAKLEIFSDCTVRVTNLRNSVASIPEPLALLYNKVADAHPSNLEPCTAASTVDGAANATVRLSAPHGYGTLDLSVTAGPQWIVFQIVDLSNWNADPEQKHLVLASLCPVDICPPGCEPPKCVTGVGPLPSITQAPFANGRFQGFRGSEGQYPDSKLVVTSGCEGMFLTAPSACNTHGRTQLNWQF